MGLAVLGRGARARTPDRPSLDSSAALSAGRSRPGRDLLLCAVAACLPDLDFLWGRHNLETHSVGFALLVGVGVSAWGILRRRKAGCAAVRTDSARYAVRLGAASALAVASHVLFDWLGSDDAPPIGVLALWPVTREFYFADAYVFDAIRRGNHLAVLLAHDTRAIVKEVILLGVPVAVLWWAAGRRARGRDTARDQTRVRAREVLK